MRRAIIAIWFIFPESQNLLTPLLLPATFFFLTLFIAHYMFLPCYKKKSLVHNVLEIAEPAESVKRVRCQEEIKSLLTETRDTTKDKFLNVLIDLCSEDRSKAHELALSVKEIDNAVFSITNKDLLDYFDQFFTITEMNNNKGRSELIEFARTCKKISETIPNSLQKLFAVHAKLYPEGYLYGWGPKPTTIVDYLTMTLSSVNRSLSQTAVMGIYSGVFHL